MVVRGLGEIGSPSWILIELFFSLVASASKKCWEARATAVFGDLHGGIRRSAVEYNFLDGRGNRQP